MNTNQKTTDLDALWDSYTSGSGQLKTSQPPLELALLLRLYPLAKCIKLIKGWENEVLLSTLYQVASAQKRSILTLSAIKYVKHILASD
jgi:hypothetical protein